jgi:hypothetical protein
MKYTRKDYVDGVCTHEEYYQQFITPVITARVLTQIGAAKVKASTDPYFNDVPLHCWDRVNLDHCGIAQKMEQAGDYLTLAGKVCIAKTAATAFRKEG